MKAYVLCIIIVTIINIYNEYIYYKKNKKFNKFLIFVDIFIICFVAAVRNINVGTDIKVYVIRLFELAKSTNNLYYYLSVCNSDLLFALLIFICKYFNNINITLFMIEFCCVLPIYIYAYKVKESKSFTSIILIFLLTMYCPSMNLMRQSIAMAFCILAYYYFDSNQCKKAFIVLFIAVLFHKTAIMFIFAFMINYIINHSGKSKVTLTMLVILLICFGGIFTKTLVQYSDYANYLELELRSFSVGSIIKRFFWIILVLMSMRCLKNKKEFNNSLIALVFLIISLLTTITSFTIPGTGRLGFYFANLAYFIFFFTIPKAFKQKGIITIMLIVSLSVFWWMGTSVKNDSSQIYPYKSDIITFLN